MAPTPELMTHSSSSHPHLIVQKKFLAYSIENPQQKIELIKSLWFRASFENLNKISNLQNYFFFNLQKYDVWELASDRYHIRSRIFYKYSRGCVPRKFEEEDK